MKKLSLLLTGVISASSYAKTIVVAVIDTGIGEDLRYNNNILCKTGHYDFTVNNYLSNKKDTFPIDTHGHGTHISGIIDQYAKNIILGGTSQLNYQKATKLKTSKIKYCQVILKYYDANALGTENLKNSNAAFQRAIDLKVDIINYSGGGAEFEGKENYLIKKALSMGIKIVAAAGNEGVSLDDKTMFHYYPAQYDSRIIVVGNYNAHFNRAPSSNWGKDVKYWEVGTDVLSYLPNNRLGFMSGTSQATAVKTGKLVREMLFK